MRRLITVAIARLRALPARIERLSNQLRARSRAKWTAAFVLAMLGAGVVALAIWCASMALLFQFAAPPD